MPTAENAALYMEVSQTPVPVEQLTDSGDNTMFTTSDAPLSRVSGFAPTILPNGIKTGGVITVGPGNSTVTVSAATCNLEGEADVSVAGDDITFTRPANNKVKISSVVINVDGTYAEEVGADGDTYSETRGANGGPPLIDVDDIEVGQVKLSDDTAVPVAVSDIRQIAGTHRELAHYPLWTVDYATGQITFVSALPLSHTGSLPKRTWASYYTPDFIRLPETSAFKPPEESHSVSSTQTYDGPRAASSKSLNQGSFNENVQEGVTDFVVQHAGENLWFKFFPDRGVSSVYLLGQGILGITRNFPADGLINVAATISSEQKWDEVF